MPQMQFFRFTIEITFKSLMTEFENFFSSKLYFVFDFTFFLDGHFIRLVI